jgi:hypothetical protein
VGWSGLEWGQENLRKVNGQVNEVRLQPSPVKIRRRQEEAWLGGPWFWLPLVLVALGRGCPWLS